MSCPRRRPKARKQLVPHTAAVPQGAAPSTTAGPTELARPTRANKRTRAQAAASSEPYLPPFDQVSGSSPFGPSSPHASALSHSSSTYGLPFHHLNSPSTSLSGSSISSDPHSPSALECDDRSFPSLPPSPAPCYSSRFLFTVTSDTAAAVASAAHLEGGLGSQIHIERQSYLQFTDPTLPSSSMHIDDQQLPQPPFPGLDHSSHSDFVHFPASLPDSNAESLFDNPILGDCKEPIIGRAFAQADTLVPTQVPSSFQSSQDQSLSVGTGTTPLGSRRLDDVQAHSRRHVDGRESALTFITMREANRTPNITVVDQRVVAHASKHGQFFVRARSPAGCLNLPVAATLQNHQVTLQIPKIPLGACPQVEIPEAPHPCHEIEIVFGEYFFTFFAMPRTRSKKAKTTTQK